MFIQAKKIQFGCLLNHSPFETKGIFGNPVNDQIMNNENPPVSFPSYSLVNSVAREQPFVNALNTPSTYANVKRWGILG